MCVGTVNFCCLVEKIRGELRIFLSDYFGCIDMDMAHEDLVFLILLCLPVKALLRFKTVCRSWRSLIESSFFISQHLHRHHHLDDQDEDSWNLIVFVPPRARRNLELYLLSGNNFQFCRSLQFQGEEGYLPDLIGTCDGIVCLLHRYRYRDGKYPDISLWNPATGEFTTLPKNPQYIPSPQIYCFHGFGFDGKTNDYKVVSVFMPIDYEHKLSPSKVSVYSSRNNSWRSMDTVLPINVVTSSPKTTFLNGGIYYWSGLHQYRGYGQNGRDVIERNLILYFDFSSEVFGTIPVPDVYSNYGWGLSLGYLRENIACIACPQNSTEWQIWVLNQCGATYSWTKLSTIAVDEGGFFSQMSKNGKIVWASNQLKLHLSHPITQERSTSPIEQLSFQFKAAIYKESLVSIKGAIGASAAS